MQKNCYRFKNEIYSRCSLLIWHFEYQLKWLKNVQVNSGLLFIYYLHFSHRWLLASMVEQRNSLEAALLVLMVLKLVQLHFLAPLQTDWKHLRTIFSVLQKIWSKSNWSQSSAWIKPLTFVSLHFKHVRLKTRYFSGCFGCCGTIWLRCVAKIRWCGCIDIRHWHIAHFIDELWRRRIAWWNSQGGWIDWHRISKLIWSKAGHFRRRLECRLFALFLFSIDPFLFLWIPHNLNHSR